jgi:hypothetical protein
MPAVFIHGVSVRKERFYSLVEQVGRELGPRLRGMPVSGAYWGDKGSSLRFGGASIPGFVEGARGALEPQPALEEIGLSDLLLEEPLVELQAAAHRSEALSGAAAALAALPAEVEQRNAVLDAAAPGLVEALTAAQLQFVAKKDRATKKTLTELVVRTIETAKEADHGITDATTLADPLTRALTAGLVRETVGEPTLDAGFPWTAVETAIKESVERELGGTRGFVAKGLASLATLALRKGLRRRIMLAQSLFIGDVVVYMTNRDAIQASVAEQINAICKQHGEEHLWLVGHSLGGIVAFEYCMAEHRDVERLVTVGSQVGVLAELGALKLTERPPGTKYGAPPRTQAWRNVYDLDDMLSFKAEPIFESVTDHAVDTGAPFPLSHSEYWSSDKAYGAIVG